MFVPSTICQAFTRQLACHPASRLRHPRHCWSISLSQHQITTSAKQCLEIHISLTTWWKAGALSNESELAYYLVQAKILSRESYISNQQPPIPHTRLIDSFLSTTLYVDHLACTTLVSCYQFLIPTSMHALSGSLPYNSGTHYHIAYKPSHPFHLFVLTSFRIFLGWTVVGACQCRSSNFLLLCTAGGTSLDKFD